MLGVGTLQARRRLCGAIVSPRCPLPRAPWVYRPLQVDNFYNQCDPAKENLCLYGYADGSYEVAPPCEEVPPEVPEPSLGINFAR